MEVKAPDTDLEVATTAVDRHNSPSASLLDAFDHNGQVVVTLTIPQIQNRTLCLIWATGSLQWIQRPEIFKSPRRSGRLSCQWTRLIWSPSSKEGRVMKSLPCFLKGPNRSAMRLALTEVEACHRVGDETGTARAWKLFLLLPRILLHRPFRGGKPKGKLLERFTDFSRCRWIQMLITSLDCGDQPMNLQTRRRRTRQDSMERRADKAEALVCMEELSTEQQAVEGAPVAPGNDRTLRELRNPVRRQPQLRAPAQQSLLSAENPARAGERPPPTGDPGALPPPVLDPIGSFLLHLCHERLQSLKLGCPMRYWCWRCCIWLLRSLSLDSQPLQSCLALLFHVD